MKHIQIFFLLSTFAFVASAQNVGIGNATPLVPLSFASTLGNKISLYGSNTTSIYGLGVQGGALQMFADNAASNIVFGYGSSTAFTERMRIMGNGNVGIGINTPTASLQVARGAGIDGTARFQGTQYSSHFNYNTAEQTYIRGGLATSEVLINDQGSGNVRIADAGGNVGIGIENGNNPTAKLHVNGTMKITDGTQGAGKILTSNAVGGASWVSPPIISAFSARSIGEQIISPPYTKILFNNLPDIQSGSAYNPNNSTLQRLYRDITNLMLHYMFCRPGNRWLTPR